MFQIVSEGRVVGMVDKPRFIKYKPESNCFVQTDKENAQGVAVMGQAYNLPGHKEIIGCPDAIILEKDGFEILFGNSVKIAKVEEDGLIVSDALIDLDETVNEKITELQDALIELDNKLYEGE